MFCDSVLMYDGAVPALFVRVVWCCVGVVMCGDGVVMCCVVML